MKKRGKTVFEIISTTLIRDLKPENLLYASREPGAQLKLGDFGFAKQTVPLVQILTSYIHIVPILMGADMIICSWTRWASNRPSILPTMLLLRCLDQLVEGISHCQVCSFILPPS